MALNVSAGGFPPAAIGAIPDKICSSRAFLRLTHCRSHTPFKMPLSIVATNARILTPVLEGGPLPSFVILVLDSAPFLKPTHPHLNARLLTILNATYKIDNLSDPSAARTIETVPIAWIVVFAVVHGETVPFDRRNSVTQIYMKPTFD